MKSTSTYYKFLIVIIIAIIIYSTFLLISDFNKIYDKISEFNIFYLPLILGIIFASWLVLFVRWSILLKNLHISIPIKSNLIIFLASFSLSATPGQLGELIKSKLLKDKFDVPVSKTAPLVFVERLYDLIGAIVVSIFGIWYLENGFIIIGIMTSFIIFIFYILHSKYFFDKISKILFNIKFIRNKLGDSSNTFDVINPSIKGKLLATCSLLSISYWFLIGCAAYLVLLSFNVHEIQLLNMISIYSSSLIIGAISFIPGGVGITEGSIAGLLTLGGVELPVALVLGVMIRIFTLWFGVIIGFIFLKLSGGLAKT